MARRRTLIGLLAVVTVTAALSSCRLKDQKQPSLVGPSELSLSLTTTVVPDILTRDGSSQAIVTVVARNETGAPKGNVTLHIVASCTTSEGRLPVDAGGLTAGQLVTGQDGHATTIYKAPSEDEFAASYCTSSTVYIDVTPVSDNVQNTLTREIALQLIADPEAPVAAYSFWPATPHINEIITFDASLSHAASGRKIVTYAWQFGTDRTGSGKMIEKTYSTAATYYVTLTVVDDLGHKGLLTRAVTVQ